MPPWRRLPGATFTRSCCLILAPPTAGAINRSPCGCLRKERVSPPAAPGWWTCVAAGTHRRRSRTENSPRGYCRCSYWPLGILSKVFVVRWWLRLSFLILMVLSNGYFPFGGSIKFFFVFLTVFSKTFLSFENFVQGVLSFAFKDFLVWRNFVDFCGEEDVQFFFFH